MNFLDVDEVVRLHNTRVPEFLLTDRDKLESAVNRSRNHAVYVDDASIHQLAAVLFEGVCMAHAFEDGNKRTAVLAAGAFYLLNGYRLEAPDTELIHLAVDVALGAVGWEKVAEWFEVSARELPWD